MSIRYDFWKSERDAADVLPNGLRVRKTETNGRFHLNMWMPKASKPFANYTFKTSEAREAYIAKAIESFEAHQAEKARYKKERSTGDASLADPGAVFEYSWGYDQTNVEYFQVVERNGLMVTLAEIGTETVPNSGYSHGMADQVRPAIGKFLMQCSECKHGQHALCHGEYIPEEAKERYVCPCREYKPEPIFHKKRLSFYKGEPSLSFDHGCGSLVKVVRFGNAEPMAVGSHYRSWYH